MHVLGTSGTHYFHVKSGQPEEIYREAFSQKERDELKRVLKELKAEFNLGVLQILDLQEGLRKYAGPGHWNDPDMLEVGNGMTC